MFSILLLYTTALGLATIQLIAGAQLTLLYLGPETVMPLASILAAIVGVLLLFWRLILGFIKRIFKFFATRLRRGAIPEPGLETQRVDPSEEA